MAEPRPLDISTRAVTVGRPAAEPDAPLNVPVTLASTYVAGGEAEYGRYANPSWTAFEDALGDLEGGRCLAFASGMAAIAAVLDLLPTGARVVAPRHSYTGTIAQLRDSETRGRILVDLVDITDTAAVVAASADADMLWIESPTNPALEVADLGRRDPGGEGRRHDRRGRQHLRHPAAAAPARGGRGHRRARRDEVPRGPQRRADGRRRRRGPTRTTTPCSSTRGLRGAIPAPLEAFLALRGLRTLPVRLERAQATAQALLPRLQAHPAVDEVRYPGFGGIVSIVLADAATADDFVARVRLWRHATSLGGVESTLERRRRWPAEAPTIPEGLVRLSVGLEHPDDLWADLDAALTKAVAPGLTPQVRLRDIRTGSPTYRRPEGVRVR